MNNNLQNKKGFTLIEMLVAVALFSIVLVVAMGAILTIIDANRKAQTLSSVMTNLNFALESMTRTIKTGVDPVISGNSVVTVDAIDPLSESFERRVISFSRQEIDGVGRIVRRIGNNPPVPVTAPEVNVTRLSFDLYGWSQPPSQATGDFDQPRTLITVEGVVRVSEDIQSTFNIQTTVSQRRLNIAGEEAPNVN